MNWLNTFGGATGFAGIILAALTLWSTRKKDTEDLRTDEAKLQVAVANSDTTRIAEIMDGYKEQVEGLRQELGDMRDRLNTLETENRNLTDRNETLLVHIGNLERGYPNPPGPPKRPWML